MYIPYVIGKKKIDSRNNECGAFGIDCLPGMRHLTTFSTLRSRRQNGKVRIEEKERGLGREQKGRRSLSLLPFAFFPSPPSSLFAPDTQGNLSNNWLILNILKYFCMYSNILIYIISSRVLKFLF